MPSLMAVRLSTIVAALSILTGSLLMVAAISPTSLAVSTTASTGLWSFFVGMLPIPGGATAPEIDASSIGNAVALLTGSLLVLGGVRRQRGSQGESGTAGATLQAPPAFTTISHLPCKSSS